MKYWRKINDEIPKYGEYVLIAKKIGKKYYVFEASLMFTNVSGNHWSIRDDGCDGVLCSCKDVHYWMIKPEAPEVK